MFRMIQKPGIPVSDDRKAKMYADDIIKAFTACSGFAKGQIVSLNGYLYKKGINDYSFGEAIDRFLKKLQS